MSAFDHLIFEKEIVLLDEVILDKSPKDKLIQFIRENRYANEIKQFGLPINNKILLHGSTGCGKTLTAKAIANALEKKLYILNLSNIVNSRIGETSKNIKDVFEKVGRERAILFLDEFDHIAKNRDAEEKDVGEMRRLVNTVIQQIDYYPEQAILIAATNHYDILDIAIRRRFQVILQYESPTIEVLDKYYDLLLAKFPTNKEPISRMYDISFAEVKDYLYTELKRALIERLESRQNSIPVLKF